MTIAKRGTTEYLEEIKFSNLVKDIDKQWSHTYADNSVEKSIEEIFAELKAIGDNAKTTNKENFYD